MIERVISFIHSDDFIISLLCNVVAGVVILVLMVFIGSKGKGNGNGSSGDGL
jgi:hypothetical protein